MIYFKLILMEVFMKELSVNQMEQINGGDVEQALVCAGLTYITAISSGSGFCLIFGIFGLAIAGCLG
jgi:bacteriocin-like protein